MRWGWQEGERGCQCRRQQPSGHCLGAGLPSVPSLASAYISNAHLPAALPTLVLFKGGKPVDRMEGVVMAGDLKTRLEYQLAQR